MGRTWGDCMTEKSIWDIVKGCAKRIGMPKLALHDLRRTCARLRHASGGELEQIQFLLRHVSVQTTERSGGSGRVADQPEVALNSVCDHPAAAGIYPQS